MTEVYLKAEQTDSLVFLARIFSKNQDSVTLLYLVLKEDTQEFDSLFPNEECKHVYDCCANWYCCGYRTIKVDDQVKYLEAYYVQNI